MTEELLDLAGCRLLRTFDGVKPTASVLAAIGRGEASGVTLFRAKNVGSIEEVREATAELQAARPAGHPPLVIGLDQEGGQLQALGTPATAWPGNLALGAIDSEVLAGELAEASGRAIGLEVAAVGGTLVYAPVCDVLQPASATPLGTRSFGSDPVRVGRLAACMVRGIQAAGVAAVLKHFPGHGAAAGDSHVTLPVVADDEATIRARDLAPFRDGIAAGAMAVLPGHLAAPALTGGRATSATVSPAILRRVLRDELGFEGVTISDALDMGGAGGADRLESTAVAAALAGIDLLMLVHPIEVEDAVVGALSRQLDEAGVDARAARGRIDRLRSQLAGIEQPALDLVGCGEHRRLARRIAEASVTLVRDPGGIVPLVLGASRGAGPIALIAPVPVDLTPAETSSYVRIGLAEALRRRGHVVRELVAPLDPTTAQIAALAGAVEPTSLAVVATFDAVSHPGQAALVGAFAARQPTFAVALRSPYDVGALPANLAVACTYGIQPVQLEALAAALTGEIPFVGRLPIR